MSKDKEYWARIVDEEVASRLIPLGLTYASNLAVIKVADEDRCEGLVYWVNDFSVKLDKSCLRPLSFIDALNLNIENKATCLEICTDCFNRELIDRKTAVRHLVGIDLGSGKDFSTKTLGMDIFNSFLRKELEDLHQLADKVKNFKFERHKVSFKSQLPDEIDLYNFFEKWGGRATCSYVIAYDDFPCHDEGSVVAKSISALEDAKGYCDKIEYDIQHNRYYAIKFKDRGTFLVSEKRYNELKAKKGK